MATTRALEAAQVIPNKAAWDNPALTENPVLSAFKAQMLNSVPTPNIPTMTAVWEPLRAIRRVHRGAMTGTQALEQAAVEYAIYTKPAPQKANPTPYIIVALAGLVAGFGGFGERFLELKKKSGNRKQRIYT